MALFSRSFLDSLRETHNISQWPGILADPEQSEVRDEIEVAVAAQPDRIRKGLARLLTSEAPRDLYLGRGLVMGLQLAGEAGATAEGLSKGGVAKMKSAEGKGFYLAPLMFHTGSQKAGRPADVERLIRTLETVFGERTFALHIRRPLSKDVDPSPIAKAVQLWLRAVDRGEWQGRHAVYEDDAVAIELTLLDGTTDGTRSALSIFVGPSVAMERLAVVDTHLQALVKQYEEQDTSLPLVALLVAHPRWQLTRGFLTQLLYGTADQMFSERNGDTRRYLANYSSERFSLFADPVFGNLSALWWLESTSDGPLAFRSWAHENPWCRHLGDVPAFPGRRFRLANDEERAALGVSGKLMTWDARDRTTWRLAPCTPA